MSKTVPTNNAMQFYCTEIKRVSNKYKQKKQTNSSTYSTNVCFQMLKNLQKNKFPTPLATARLPLISWDSKWSPNNSSLPPHWQLLLCSWVYYFLGHGETLFLPIQTKYLKSCLFCLYLLETGFISVQWNCIALFVGKVLEIHSSYTKNLVYSCRNR